jgi:hypothetical protein
VKVIVGKIDIMPAVELRVSHYLDLIPSGKILANVGQIGGDANSIPAKLCQVNMFAHLTLGS